MKWFDKKRFIKKIWDLLDKSFIWDLLLSFVNRKNIENLINNNKELNIRLSDLLIENILWFRNNLIVLVWWLIALL